MYSSAKASAGGKGQLSQSALSYLQGLEQSTKKLKAGANEKPKPPASLSSRRGSLSSMISQLRSGKSLDSSEEEDVFNESFGKLSSILSESSDSSGREKVLLDLNFDPLPKSSPNRALPGLAQVGRSSMAELRELRNSIDQSLQQPIQQNLKKDSARGASEKPKPRRNLFKKQESEELSEVEEEVETERVDTKKSTAPKKSPFKNTVESGSSDLESIDFEVAEEPVERLRERKVSFQTPTPSESSTSKASSSSDPSSRSESSSSSSRSSSSASSASSKASTVKASSRSSSSSSSSSSTVNGSVKDESGGYESESEIAEKEETVEKTQEPSNPAPEPIPEKIKFPEKPPKRISPPDEVTVTKRMEQSPPKVVSPEEQTGSVPPDLEKQLHDMMQRYMADLKPIPIPKDVSRQGSKPSSVSSATQTEELVFSPAKRVEITPIQEALLVSDGVQEALQSVIKTHIQMVDEMNRLEWNTKTKWQQELERLKGAIESPSMDRLTRLIKERNRKE